MISLPRLPRGRPSELARTAHDVELNEFCDQILKINSRLDFQVSSRGWCYILEEHGLGKGDFDTAQELIAECRRRRFLPMDIVAEDGARAFEHLEALDADDPDEWADGVTAGLEVWHHGYTPDSFWDGQDVYIEMLVEKIDLKSLFSPICAEFHIPIANARGWSDLNTRWAMLERIRGHADEGKDCVILYCGGITIPPG